MEKYKNVSAVIDSHSELIGSTVSVAGIFVLLGNNDAYIVNAREDKDKKENAIKVKINNIERILYSHVLPPIGGRKYFYVDTACITGVLYGKENEFPVTLAKVSELLITRREKIYNIVIPSEVN